jgi:hypothetical protein
MKQQPVSHEYYRFRLRWKTADDKACSLTNPGSGRHDLGNDPPVWRDELRYTWPK